MKEHLHTHAPFAMLILSLFLGLHISWRLFETGVVFWQSSSVSQTVRKWEVTPSTQTLSTQNPSSQTLASQIPSTSTTASSSTAPSVSASTSGAMVGVSPRMVAAAQPGNPGQDPRTTAPGSVNSRRERHTTANPDPRVGGGTSASSATSATLPKYASIVKSGMFGIQPTPPAQMHMLKGILGDKAIVDGQLLAIGQMAGDSKLVEIGAKSVFLEKDGQRTELRMFQ